MLLTFTQPPSAPKRAHAKGFILALTLWIIALFGLGIAAISTWIGVATENARTLRSRVDDEIALSNAKSELIFALATRPMTYRGLEVGIAVDQPVEGDKKNAPVDTFMAMSNAMQETSRVIAFDRRPYVMENNRDYIIQIQDGRGLINLNRIQPPLLRRLLALYDTSEALRSQLPDTLQDWVDEDEFTRLAGAEKPDYDQLRRLPPTNARLTTPMEAQNILGWDQVPRIWEDDLKAPIFSTCTTAGFNPNTAPEASLIVHTPGLTEDAAKFIVERRQAGSFRHAREFLELANISVPNEAFFFGTSPGSCMVIDFVNRTTAERTRISLTLVPRGQNQPWQVDYAFRIPSLQSGTLDGLDPQLTFPTPETLTSSSDGHLTAIGIR
ncbi:MAG: type II secretion system protein GspK [Rhodospirillaceae bacterium]